MADQATIGIIGCGGMASAHLAGYRALYDAGWRDFAIVATCDVRVEKAEALAEQVAQVQGQRPVVYADFEQMLSTMPNLDAVDINTDHRSHHVVAVACLQAGKHVTIEKPLAITMRAAKAILDAARSSGKLLQVAENYRRQPEHRAIQAVLRSGRIGRVRLAFWIDVAERLWYWQWRDHRSAAGGGWSLDGGVHFADLFRFHIGPVQELCAQVHAFHPYRYEEADVEGRRNPIEVDVEDTMMATLKFENGALGEWTSTTAAPGQQWSRRVVHGDCGSLDFTDGLSVGGQQTAIADLVADFESALSEKEREQLYPRGVKDSVATELWEFIQAVQGRAEIETDGMAGYKALAICFALYESATLNAPVRVADIENLTHERYQEQLNCELGLV